MKVGQLKKQQPPTKRSFKDQIFDFVFGKLPYRVSQYLRQNGHKTIETITVYRAPIMGVIDKLFNIISLTKWDQAKKELGYQDLFHLYMVVQLSDDTKAVLEKNQTISVTDDFDQVREQAEAMPIDLQGKVISLDELLENTKREMGEERFYKYDAFSNNCQDWLYAALKANGLLTPQAGTFIKQNAGELLKAMPSFTEKFARATTDIASYANRFLQRIGLKGFEEGGLII